MLVGGAVVVVVVLVDDVLLVVVVVDDDVLLGLVEPPGPRLVSWMIPQMTNESITAISATQAISTGRRRNHGIGGGGPPKPPPKSWGGGLPGCWKSGPP